jgi:hypothetical protein
MKNKDTLLKEKRMLPGNKFLNAGFPRVKTRKTKRTKIITDSCVIEKIKQDNEIEKQVIVHCKCNGPMIRIWPTTFLNDRDSIHKSKLIAAYNIPMYPIWLEVKPYTTHSFTLIFSGLPKTCKTFDLSEEIPQAGAFFQGKIKRNKTDVYRIYID